MIDILCPTCQVRLQVADGQGGSKVLCSKCGQRLLVPANRNRTILAQQVPSLPIEATAIEVPSSAIPAPLPFPSTIPVAGFYYMNQGKRLGPVDLVRLQHLVRTRQLDASDMVWLPSANAWQSANKIAGLFALDSDASPKLGSPRLNWKKGKEHLQNVMRLLLADKRRLLAALGVILAIGSAFWLKAVWAPGDDLSCFNASSTQEGTGKSNFSEIEKSSGTSPLPSKPESLRPEVASSGQRVYEKALKSCVFINIPAVGSGSGVLVNADEKLVVTNYHVVRRASNSGGDGVLQKYDSQLTNLDARDAKNRVYKLYEFRFQFGRKYRIDMESSEIDSFLVVADSRNKLIASDDDSGGSLNARVLLDPPASDNFKIMASTFAGGTGQFTLTIREWNPIGIPGSGGLPKFSENGSLEVFFPEFDDKLVLDKNRYFAKSKSSPEKYRAKVLVTDEAKDLALLQLNVVPTSVEPLLLSKESATPGERVHSIGNPASSGALWVYTSGTARTAPYRKQWQSTGISGILKHDAWIIETQSPTNPGDSGGPLLNDRAELVGITQGNLVSSNSISIFLDVNEVRNFLKANGFSGLERNVAGSK